MLGPNLAKKSTGGWNFEKLLPNSHSAPSNTYTCQVSFKIKDF